MYIYETPYAVRKAEDKATGMTRYYVSFKDGQAARREIEVSRPIFAEFRRYLKADRNYSRWHERHRERDEFDDDTLHVPSKAEQRSAEDTAFDCLHNERLRLAVQELPEIQRRRFVLYHEFGLTYEQIAEMEGCSSMSVFRTVRRATQKIRDAIKFSQN